ncbi:predicted protein [Plenodomus lingam JN3]|uniref:Predicted protein n=1 Tax=Leptosphaeria maculans (strain JN3 / isolate v23.1.3 / race Av1-4-5-6-7-8) TaxID=985895 RepID=E5A518_LEPMJ|nr:predicted protein [Plenodomus lingam JN3]CBX98716.1 predicted protein [Plenodomus lingam JN3]
MSGTAVHLAPQRGGFGCRTGRTSNPSSGSPGLRLRHVLWKCPGFIPWGNNIHPASGHFTVLPPLGAGVHLGKAGHAKSKRWDP